VPLLRLPVNLEYLPVRYVPYTGAAPVPEWLPEHPSRPRVCLTAGLGGREIMGEDWIPYPVLFEAVADLDIEVVATLSAEQLESVGSIPDNVKVFDFYPLNVLVPSCSAVIHHGGGGAFAVSLAHGVPQLVMSTEVWWDAIAKAKELAARRAALYLEPEGLTADVLRKNLVRLIEDPSFRAGAAKASAEFLATPSPNEIVPELEALITKHRTRRA
jgi:UDP:flavonoid glycosyltransferase YjiC (YdhE family)